MNCILLGIRTNIRPELEDNLEGLVTVCKALKFIRRFLPLLVYLNSLQKSKALCLRYLGHIIKGDDKLLSDAHDAGVEADIVLSQVHTAMMKDALVEGTAKVIEDYFLFGKREQFTYLCLR